MLKFTLENAVGGCCCCFTIAFTSWCNVWLYVSVYLVFVPRAQNRNRHHIFTSHAPVNQWRLCEIQMFSFICSTSLALEHFFTLLSLFFFAHQNNLQKCCCGCLFSGLCYLTVPDLMLRTHKERIKEEREIIREHAHNRYDCISSSSSFYHIERIRTTTLFSFDRPFWNRI